MATLLAACPGDDTSATTDASSSSSGGDSATADPTTSPTQTTADSSSGAPSESSSSGVDSTEGPTEGSTSSTDDGASSTDGATSSGGPACGDGVVDLGEDCDGDDLAGEDCVGLGFEGGALGCADDCSLDTTACTMATCGDGIVEDPEICDGADLGGQDCVMQGFDAGVLACAGNCMAFDTSGCRVCGDGVAAGPEACDGDDLGGLDCIGLGFGGGGALACDAMCALDASGCIAATCGNGVVEVPESCDGAGANGVSCIELGVPPSGGVSSCCIANGGPGCGDAGCQATVCGLDAYCCDATWDEQCANEAADLCDAALCPDPTCTAACTLDAVSCDLGNACIEEFIGQATGPAVSTGSTVGEDDDITQFCGFFGAADRVISFLASSAGTYTFDLIGSDYDTVMSLSTGCGPTFACDDDGAGVGGASSLTIDLAAGAQLTIAVSGYGGDTGNYVLNVTPPAATPVESVDGCDPTWCVFTGAAGPNGGDLCTCTFVGADHPLTNDHVDASCFAGLSGNDLLLAFDLAGYSAWSVTSCNGTPGDSSIAVYDDDPLGGGAEQACSEDAVGEPSFCAELEDGGGLGPPLPAPAPASGLVYILVDEWTPNAFWNGSSTRVVEIEAIP